MTGFVGGIAGGFLGKIATFFITLWVAVRKGKQEQRIEDLEASNKEAQQARKIDDAVHGESDDALDRELRP